MKSRTKVNLPMIGRKANLVEVKTGDEGSLPGQFRGDTYQVERPAASGGFRLIGGWSSWAAGMRNAGTLHRDAKRNASSGRPTRAKVSMRGQGAESLVVVLIARETGKERRGGLFRAVFTMVNRLVSGGTIA